MLFSSLHAESVTSKIVRSLDDKGMRYGEIMYALVKLQAESAIPAIAQQLKSKKQGKRETASQTLAAMGIKSATPEIIEMLNSEYASYVQQRAAIDLSRMDYSSPKLTAWQKEKLKEIEKQISSEYPDNRTEAARTLGSIFTKQSAELLNKLAEDSEESVVRATLYSIGNIAEYHPEWFLEQAEQLIALTERLDLNLQPAAITALGRLVSFHGKATAKDFLEMEQKVRATLRDIIVSPEQKNSFRLTAIDALGKTNRQACAEDLYKLMTEQLTRSEDDTLRSLCLLWLGRMKYEPAHAYIENELKQLEKTKAAWRMQRDQKKNSDDENVADIGDGAEKTRMKYDAYWEHHEYRLSTALARIDPTTTGIELLNHSLYHVRQGAIRALAGRPDAARIEKIIQAHQNFDSDDLPSPFPYAAFRAIDLALWNLEYTGKKDDVSKLKDILKNLKPCQVPGQEGAIKERLEWTIDRLEGNLAKNAETAGAG